MKAYLSVMISLLLFSVTGKILYLATKTEPRIAARLCDAIDVVICIGLIVWPVIVFMELE